MGGIAEVLQRMRSSIAASTAEGAAPYVFALTSDSGAAGVQAVALVSVQQGYDPLGAVPVVEIGDVAVKPTADRERGAGPELFRQISEWTRISRGSLTATPVSDGLRGYYKSIGFKLLEAGAPGQPLAFRDGASLERLAGGKEFHMLTL